MNSIVLSVRMATGGYVFGKLDYQLTLSELDSYYCSTNRNDGYVLFISMTSKDYLADINNIPAAGQVEINATFN